ncbi:MAG: TIGR02147 family protein [Bdellovibrionales bacterium]
MEQITQYYRQFLKSELDRRIQDNARYSLRSFAKALNVSAGNLSDIINGKRPLTYKTAQKIVQAMPISPEAEKLFLGSVVNEQLHRSLNRTDPKIKNLKKTFEARTMDVDIYRLISDWYHLAILEMVFLSDFRLDPSWIAKELNISPMQAKSALDRLFELGLLEDDGEKITKKDVYFTLERRRGLNTNSAQISKQKQIRQMAIQSLENDPLSTRSMTTVTMCIDPDKLDEAKKRIDEFNQSMCEFLTSDKREQIYVMEVSLFPLQKKKESER